MEGPLVDMLFASKLLELTIFFAHLAIRQWQWEQCGAFFYSAASGMWVGGVAHVLVLRAKQDWHKRSTANSR